VSRFLAVAVTIAGQLVHAQVSPELGGIQAAARLAADVRAGRERAAQDAEAEV
jgi:hypothetical protein